MAIFQVLSDRNGVKQRAAVSAASGRRGGGSTRENPVDMGISEFNGLQQAEMMLLNNADIGNLEQGY